MSGIGNIAIPFEDCDADTAQVDSTGGAASDLFTNLAITKQRAVMIQNRGAANLLVGKSLAAARWRVLPGAVLVVYARDLAKLFLKSEGATGAVDIFQAI